MQFVDLRGSCGDWKGQLRNKWLIRDLLVVAMFLDAAMTPVTLSGTMHIDGLLGDERQQGWC